MQSSRGRRIKEGFDHQRMVVMPAPLAARASKGRDAYDHVATATGYFPKAVDHYVTRPMGTAEFILIACLYGRGTVWVQSRSYDVQAGQVAILPPGVSHTYQASSASPWSIYWLHLGGRRACTTANWLTDEGRNIVIPLAITSSIASLFDSVFLACVQACASGDAGLTALYTSQLLAGLLARRSSQDGGLDRIDQTIQVMSNRISGQITVTELAHVAKLSPSQFASQFKRRTGSSVLNYYIRLKMRRAAQLLDATTDPIQQIAYQLGYEDPLYFSRQFRIAYGMSPRAYRSITKG